jgi:hypothetical protein
MWFREMSGFKVHQVWCVLECAFNSESIPNFYLVPFVMQMLSVFVSDVIGPLS